MSRHLITADWHIRSTVPSCIDATQEDWVLGRLSWKK